MLYPFNLYSDGCQLLLSGGRIFDMKMTGKDGHIKDTLYSQNYSLEIFLKCDFPDIIYPGAVSIKTMTSDVFFDILKVRSPNLSLVPLANPLSSTS